MLHLIVEISTPLLLAGSGGLITELAGTLNIGLEGLILIGAFAAVLGTHLTGSYFVGVLCALVSGAAMSMVFVAFGHKMRANTFITGLAINLLSIGLTAVLSQLIFASQGVVSTGLDHDLFRLHLPFLERIPVLGPLISGHTLFTPVSWAIVIATALFVRKTRRGLELRAIGLKPEAARIRGVNVSGYQAAAIAYSGLTCALAGAVLSLKIGAFVPNMSAGRGWIALVMVFLGGKRMWGVAVAGIFFSTAQYAASAAQGALGIPRTLALAFPYLITLLSMVLFEVVRRRADHIGARPK